MSKKTLLLMAMVALCSATYAQEEIRLFPKGAPGDKISYIEKDDSSGEFVGGLSVNRKTNVGVPEITIYPAPGKTKSAAMMVCPGGGYNILA